MPEKKTPEAAAEIVDIEAQKSAALEAFAKAHLVPLITRINALESQIAELRALHNTTEGK